MIGIVITGHGNFATGMVSALKLIAGEAKNLLPVDFLKSYSTEDLREKIYEAILSLGDEVIVLTDINGGSPYNVSVVLQAEHPELQIAVVSGTNLPMAIATIFEREGASVKELAEIVVDSGKDSIGQFVFKGRKKAELLERKRVEQQEVAEGNPSFDLEEGI